MYNVAFAHEGYGYYGMLMWVPQDDAEARPFMMEALRTLSVPEELIEGAMPMKRLAQMLRIGYESPLDRGDHTVR